jgi:hypothetical protein
MILEISSDYLLPQTTLLFLCDRDEGNERLNFRIRKAKMFVYN